MHPVKWIPIFIVLSVLVLSCNENNGPVDQGTASGTVCIWLSSDKDTYVSCGRTAGCEESEHNFGTFDHLVVAGGQNGRKRSYVHFVIPNVPEGTEVLEAYFELYHSGKNEDGKTDDIRIPFGELTEPFAPLTVNWDTRPDPGFTEGARLLKLHSQAWSGSEDIKDIVAGYFANPETHLGFFISWSESLHGGLEIEKGFYSNNERDRTQNELGRAPRLLVKVKFPEGKSTADMTVPFMTTDNDLTDLARPTLMLLFRQGDWPEDWEVTKRQ
jgi:hypothetical protein